MKKKWLLILFLVTFAVQSCNFCPYDPLDALETFLEFCEECSTHGHAHAEKRGYSYSTDDLKKFVKFIHNEYGGSLQTLEIASPPITPDSMPDSNLDMVANLKQPVGGADDYFDQEMDGVRLGNLEVWFEGETGRMKIPVIVSFNAAKDNTAYASIAFPNLALSILDKKPVWHAGYSGEVKIIPRSYPTTVDLSFAFDTKMMKGILPVAKAGKKLKITLTGYFSRTSDYFGFNNATSKGYNPTFCVDLDLYKRMTQTLGMEGLWMGGFLDSIYAGKELGEFYHPITLLMKHINTEYRGANYMTLMTHSDTLNDLKITGKKLWVAESTSWGYAFDMTRRGPDKLVGKFIYRLNPESADYKYTLYRIGFGGNKMRVKRVKPKRVPLGNRKNKPTLLIKGVGFAPGAMVFFNDSNIEIKEIEYVNNKKLKVTVQAIDPIERGQKIGVRVINPDNRSAMKPGIFKTK